MLRITVACQLALVRQSVNEVPCCIRVNIAFPVLKLICTFSPSLHKNHSKHFGDQLTDSILLATKVDKIIGCVQS